jgi:hypothetical protein
MASGRVSKVKGKVIDIPGNPPTIGTATAGSGSADIPFTAPSTSTGGPIFTYTAISNPSSITATGTTSPITVTGLTNGTAYTFTIAGTNATGNGPASAASNSVTPAIGPRFFMYLTDATPADAQIRGLAYKDNYYYMNNDQNYILTKYSDTGSIQSLKQKLASFPGGNIPYWVGLDSSSNIYMGGMAYSVVASTYGTEIVKFNSSGAIQWQKNIYSTQGIFSSRGASFAIDSSDNIYFHASSYDNPYTGKGSALTVKLNSSGSILWQKELRPSASTVQNRALVVDSSGNVYVSSLIDSSSSLIAKYNSSGTLQWQKSFASSSPDTGMGLDSSGNLYVAFQQTVSTNKRSTLMKLNSSGTVQWQRYQDYGGSHNEASQQSIAVDSSDNIYIYGYQSSDKLWIGKYDTSGTIQWKRQITTPVQCYPTTITVRGSTEFAVAWYEGSNAYMAALPVDGSKTGTYSINGKSFTYVAATFTEGAASISDSTSSYTDSTTSIPITNSSLTTSAVTITTSTLSI